MASNPASAAGNGDLMARALREAFYAGIIAFGLFVLLIGLKTDQNIRNELILVQRWGLLAVVVGLVMIVRFAMVAYIRPFMERQKIADKATGLLPDSFAVRFFRTPYFIAALVVAALLYLVGGSLASICPSMSGWCGGWPSSTRWPGCSSPSARSSAPTSRSSR